MTPTQAKTRVIEAIKPFCIHEADAVDTKFSLQATTNDGTSLSASLTLPEDNAKLGGLAATAKELRLCVIFRLHALDVLLAEGYVDFAETS